MKRLLSLLGFLILSNGPAFAGLDNPSGGNAAIINGITGALGFTDGQCLAASGNKVVGVTCGSGGIVTGPLAITQTFPNQSGTIIANFVNTSASGNVDGTADIRDLQLHNTITGSHDVANVIVNNNQTDLQHTSGTVVTAIGQDTYVRLGLSTNAAFAGHATNVYGTRTHIANESATGTINKAYSIYVQDIDLASPSTPPLGTVNFAHGVHVGAQQGQPPGLLPPPQVLIPGRVVNEAIGVYVQDMNAGALLTAAYFTHMQDSSPDQTTYPKYALYFDGSARSIHRGSMTIGDIIEPSISILNLTRSLEGFLQGSYYPLSETVTFAAHADGTANFRGFRQLIQFNGANPASQIDAATYNMELNHTVSAVAGAYGTDGYIRNNSTGTVTTVTANNWAIYQNGDGNLGTATLYLGTLQFQAGAGTIANTYGLKIAEIGGSRVTTESVAVDIANQTNITGGGVQAALRSVMSSGTGRYNLLITGSAVNVIAGKTNIGDATVPTTSTLQVTSTLGTVGTAANLVGLTSNASLSANADNLTQFRAYKSAIATGGANSFAALYLADNQLEVSSTAGTVAAANGIHAYVRNNSGAAITVATVFSSQFYANGNGNTTTADLYYAKVNFQAGTGTIDTARAFHADNVGGTRVVTAAIGFDAEANSSGAVLTANFRAQNSAGTGRWSFYNASTAPWRVGAAYQEWSEMTAPAAGAADTGRFFLQDNGAGKTQACVIFSSGAAQCFATQP